VFSKDSSGGRMPQVASTGVVDLSTEDDQLVPQQGVFRKEFRCSSRHVGKRAEHKGSRRWFDPTRKTGRERATVGTDSLLDQSEYTTHEIEPHLREKRHLAREYEQNGRC
jgi:hypothetical protein